MEASGYWKRSLKDERRELIDPVILLAPLKSLCKLLDVYLMTNLGDVLKISERKTFNNADIRIYGVCECDNE